MKMSVWFPVNQDSPTKRAYYTDSNHRYLKLSFNNIQNLSSVVFSLDDQHNLKETPISTISSDTTILQREIIFFKKGEASNIPTDFVTINVSNIDSLDRIFLYTHPREDEDIEKAKNNFNPFTFIPEDSLYLIIILNNHIKEEGIDPS